MNFLVRSIRTFLLLDAEAHVRRRDPNTSRAIATRCESATERVRAALELGQPLEATAAIALYRDSASLLLDAIFEERAPLSRPQRVDAGELWARYEAELAHELPPPDYYPIVRDAFVSDDAAYVDRLPLLDRVTLREQSASLVRWLRGNVEPRTPTELGFARMVRVLGVLAVFAFIGTRVSAYVRSLDNLARGCPVVASSRLSGTPTADNATNGTIEKTYGVHTEVQENASVRVELRAPKHISEIRVHARGDGYGSESVPFVVEIGDDGTTFQELATRTLPFSDSEVFVVPADHKVAKFVRVRRIGHGYIALAEIEVFEHQVTPKPAPTAIVPPAPLPPPLPH